MPAALGNAYYEMADATLGLVKILDGPPEGTYRQVTQYIGEHAPAATGSTNWVYVLRPDGNAAMDTQLLRYGAGIGQQNWSDYLHWYIQTGDELYVGDLFNNANGDGYRAYLSYKDVSYDESYGYSRLLRSVTEVPGTSPVTCVESPAEGYKRLVNWHVLYSPNNPSGFTVHYEMSLDSGAQVQKVHDSMKPGPLNMKHALFPYVCVLKPNDILTCRIGSGSPAIPLRMYCAYQDIYEGDAW